MQFYFVKSTISLLRSVQLVGAGIAVLLGVAIVLRFLKLDTLAGNSPQISSYAVVMSMLVLPPTVLFVGSLVQLVLGKNWAFILVLIGGGFGFIFVGVNAGFLFVYIGDKLGKLIVFADLLVIVATIGVAIVNLTMRRFSKPEVYK